jgi:hypothetical protein
VRTLIAITAILLATACGDGDQGAGSDPTASALGSTEMWCERLAEDLPVLASPNPDGHELEYLDLHIARADALAAGAPGVPAAATDAAGEIAATLAEIRERVADGEALPSVLQDVFSDSDSTFMGAAEVLDDEAATICPDRSLPGS